MKYDFNVLERTAMNLIASGRHRDAMKIYLFMADGDSSLDGGYLGERLGECYEALGDIHAARYWYGRAVEENPDLRIGSAEARDRLRPTTLSEFEALLPSN